MYSNEQILSALEHSEIAGGAQYEHDIGLRDSNVVITSRSDFADHAGDSGKVLWVPGDQSIDLSGWSGTLRATVASDRGVDGSKGGLLYTDDHGKDSDAWDGGSGRGVLQCRTGARLTGLRIRGPYHDHHDNPEYPGYVPIDSGNSSERRRKREQRYARGLNVQGRNVEVDNCELYGWPNQAINIGSSGTAYSPHIHHLHGHDCMMVGFGYVVDVIKGHPLIEDSYFNATRHSVDGFGYPECGYTLENSVFGPITYSHAVDMHTLAENTSGNDLTAGGRVEVRRCTFCFDSNIHDSPAQAIAFRGYPTDGYVTENCRFLHTIEGEEPPFNVANSSGYAPYRQVNVPRGEWHDWEFIDNQYGPDAPYREGIGASVNLDDPAERSPDADSGLSRAQRRRQATALARATDSLRDIDRELAAQTT